MLGLSKHKFGSRALRRYVSMSLKQFPDRVPSDIYKPHRVTQVW